MDDVLEPGDLFVETVTSPGGSKLFGIVRADLARPGDRFYLTRGAAIHLMGQLTVALTEPGRCTS